MDMATQHPEAEMRRQLTAVFERASYPVTEPFELIPLMPDGPTTTFEAGGVAISAVDLGMGYAEYQEYPYEEATALVEDLLRGLREDGRFE